MRLVILLQDLEYGGTQRYALTLLEHLDRRRFSPELWTLRAGDDLIPDTGRNEVRRLSTSTWVGPAGLLNLARHLKEEPPDLLYTLTVTPNIWGRLIGKARGIPAIVSGYRAMHPKQHEKWLWPLSRRIICNAHALKEIMVRRHGVDARRIAVIHNAVDTGYYSPAGNRKAPRPTILFVGRLVKDKSPFHLIQAFALVVRSLPEARLIMVGNGPLKPGLIEAVSTLRLNDRITLVPGQRDVRPFYQTAWVLASSSIREGCPNVVLEAMASGLPVAAASVGGVPELAANGETGFLVKPGRPKDLADALIGILEDQTLRMRLGQAARNRAERFGIRKMVDKTETVLLEAWEDASAGR